MFQACMHIFFYYVTYLLCHIKMTNENYDGKKL